MRSAKLVKPGEMTIMGVHKDRRIFYSGGWHHERAGHGGAFNVYEPTVLDDTTLQLVEVGNLHKAVDYSQTALGSGVLFRSLVQPPTNLEHILAKQDSIREIESDDRLRAALDDYLSAFSAGEGQLMNIMTNGMHPTEAYSHFKRAARCGRLIAEAAQAIPSAQSPYLQGQIDGIKDFAKSDVYRLFRGPIYRTRKGLRSKENVSWYTPRWRFRPSRFTVGTVGPLLPSVAAFTGVIERGEQLEPYAFPMAMGAMWGLIYASIMKPTLDTNTAIFPLIRMAYEDHGFLEATEAIGRIDEMLSHVRFAKKFPHPVVLPTITDDAVHHLEARGMTNAVLGDGEFVDNSVNLNGARLTFITGPNSGGKTTYCKSLAQLQLLGQIGSHVPASEASINLADMVAYQAPQFDSLRDTEGRFGTELQRTRDIFFRTTPKSLLILDELSEGTTPEEKHQQSRKVLDRLGQIGNNTVLVTHNHPLVADYRTEGTGQYLMVEFMDQDPTHRMVPGISTESHADRVAKKMGFSEADMDGYLREQGHIED